MPRTPRSLLATTVTALIGAVALTGCGVSPAYTPVRTVVAAEPEPVETAPAPMQQAAYDDTDPAALTDFRDTLAPYGSWEEDAAYGTVWVPASDRVGSDFAPYKTGGHWELDQDEQWLWVSDYDDSFGWVVFHYGRWAHTEARGWVWIPGRRYAPAWVAWQTGDPGYGYIGWAAMPPAYYWHSGAVVWLDVYPSPYYVYCPTSYVFYRDWHHHAVPRSQVVAVATPMRPYGSPQHGGGRTYAEPHRGPGVRSGYVPDTSYPTSRHRLADGQRRYAVPSSPATAGTGVGGSPRAGSRSRPQSFDSPGAGDGRSSRSFGVSEAPSSRPAAGPDGPPGRGTSSSGAFGPSRGTPTAVAPPGRSSSVFDSRAPSGSSPPVARGPSGPSGPTRAPSAFSAPTAPSAPVARPSPPSSSAPVRAPSHYTPPSAPVSRPSSPSFSAPSRSAPSVSHSSSSSSSPSRSVSRPSSGGSRGRR